MKTSLREKPTFTNDTHLAAYIFLQNNSLQESINNNDSDDSEDDDDDDDDEDKINNKLFLWTDALKSV